MATAGDIMETGTGSAGVNPAANRPRFTWRYDHKLDAQGRVPLPAKWRPEDPSCLLYTSPSPRDVEESRMPSSA